MKKLSILFLILVFLTGFSGCSFKESFTKVGVLSEVLRQKGPEALLVDPVDKQVDVRRDANMNVAFDKKLDANSINQANIFLSYINPDLKREKGQSIPVDLSYLGDQNIIQVKPKETLLNEETVELVVKCSVKGEDGIPIEKDDQGYIANVCFTSSFITEKDAENK